MSRNGAPVHADSRMAAPVFSGMRGSKNAMDGMETAGLTAHSVPWLRRRCIASTHYSQRRRRARGDSQDASECVSESVYYQGRYGPTRRSVRFATTGQVPHKWGYRFGGQFLTVEVTPL